MNWIVADLKFNYKTIGYLEDLRDVGPEEQIGRERLALRRLVAFPTKYSQIEEIEK